MRGLPHRRHAGVFAGAWLGAVMAAAACGVDRAPGAAGDARTMAAGAGTAYVAMAEPAPGTATMWEAADWEIFVDRAEWALENRLDTLSLGDAMAALGQTLVGTPYVPQTLEAPGPEALVVNFRALDCVTFVENVMGLARFVRAPGAGRLLDEPALAQTRYEEILTRIRYRDGSLKGYPSRLHYFSDWIANGEEKGLVRDLGRSLGGVADEEPVNFMTSHASAYRQLGEDPEVVTAVRATEERLSRTPRWFIPEGRLEAAAEGIRNGDVIAATSTVTGLDVAHTGLALWVDGSLRLMHAPLVGDSVQISEETLAARVLRISGQDGIMVARPCPESGPC